MSAGLTIEQMKFLAERGMSIEDAIAFAELGKKRSGGAERQARYRARKAGRNVTSDVTRDASLPPYEGSTPPIPSDEGIAAAPKAKRKPPAVAKPEGVTEPVWRDFENQRKTPVSETALAGIRSEAEKAGWSLNAALAEAVARGWQSFKAEWVTRRAESDGPSDFLAHLRAKQAAIP